MEQIGKILTCDRCGEKVFMERDKAERVCMDVKGMVLEHFANEEEIKSEWSQLKELDLCPACAESYREAMKDFMANGRRRTTYCDD